MRSFFAKSRRYVRMVRGAHQCRPPTRSLLAPEATTKLTTAASDSDRKSASESAHAAQATQSRGYSPWRRVDAVSARW